MRCPHCRAPMRLIAFILDPPVIERILVHIGEPTEALAAEFHTILLVYTEFDCSPFGWDMMLRGDRCEGGELEIHGSAGSPIWVRIQPTGQAYPCGLIGHEYHYLVTFDGLQSGGVQVERTTWGRVKSTFGETR